MGNSVFHQLETKKLSQRQTTKNVAIKNVNGGCADQSHFNKILLWSFFYETETITFICFLKLQLCDGPNIRAVQCTKGQ